MSILDLNLDVLPFLQLSADDAFGTVGRVQAQAEKFFKTYCARNFEQTAMKEVIRNCRDWSLWLKEYPVISVQKLSAGRREALSVSNSNTQTTAQVSVDVNGVNLSYNYAAQVSLTFALYPTMVLLAGGINAGGNGWSATVTPGFEAMLASELVPQMGLECIAGTRTSLYVPGVMLSAYQLDENTGEITAPSDGTGFDTGTLQQRFPGVNVRFWGEGKMPGVIYANYAAGYAPSNMPADLKLGILALIRSLFDKINEGTFNVEDYSVDRMRKKLLDLPAETKLALELHKRRRV